MLFAFVVLDSVSSVLIQCIGWWKRLRSDLFSVDFTQYSNATPVRALHKLRPSLSSPAFSVSPSELVNSCLWAAVNRRYRYFASISYDGPASSNRTKKYQPFFGTACYTTSSIYVPPL